MTTSPVQTLLGAVRRRLRRGRFVAALRLALWGSSGLMLFAAAVHLGARPVATGVILWALAMLWASMLVWVGWRRPTDLACALWADRHLGGASAFSTLLDMGRGTQAKADGRALRCLEDWAAIRAAAGLRLLAQAQEPARLSRPLLATLVCTTLATIVLALPDSAPSSKQQVAASKVADIAEPATPGAELPASATLVSDIASALRSAPSRDLPERAEAGGAAAAGPGKAGGPDKPSTAQTGNTPPSQEATATVAASDATATAAASAGATQATGTGSGRQAGDSRDNRADVGASRVPGGAMSVQRSDLRAGRASAERRADMDQLASYDKERSMSRATALRAEASPEAATPPAVTESTPLSPTETNYVQAWMKASARHR